MERTTHLTDSSGHVSTVKDNWRVNGPNRMKEFTGRTVFALADPTAVPEGMEAMEIRKVAAKDILQNIRNEKWPAQARQHVDGRGKCLGVTFEKSSPRVSVMSAKQVKITMLLNEVLWETMACQDFEWTSLQVNVNTASGWHKDSNNVGPSCILLLGDFDGGEFVHSDDQVSTSETGTWFPFDGSRLHSSLEFDGYRVSVVAFQHMHAYRLSDDVKKQLVGLGFRSRMLSTGNVRGHPTLSGSAGEPSASQGGGEGSAGEPSATLAVGDVGTGGSEGMAGGNLAAASVRSASPSHHQVGPQRLIIELCTSENSRIGQRTVYSKGCKVVRITVDDDLTTDIGLNKALEAARAFVGPNILVWISIPCTGGSPWQRINVFKSERARALVEGHYRLFRALFHNVKIIAEYVRSHGGYIAIEWPKACAYWMEQDVVEFIHSQGLQSVYLDGCMFGLVSQHGSSAGQPIRKPWRVDTNSPVLCQHLARVCDGSHSHVPCQGSDTKDTEGYTDELVACIHKAFDAQCQLNRFAHQRIASAGSC